MQFSTVATVAAIAAVANAQYNSTVTATTVENQTTLVTITDCEEHICKETVSPALVSTATVTENNTITKYTTWCPISGETKTTKVVETTTAAASSSKPAEKKPETTTTTAAATSSKPAEKKPETTTTTAPATKKQETTTTAPATSAAATTTQASSTKKQETTVKISSYTGAAAQVLPAAGALIAGAAALLL